jgi:hypothetical protein
MDTKPRPIIVTPLTIGTRNLAVFNKLISRPGITKNTRKKKDWIIMNITFAALVDQMVFTLILDAFESQYTYKKDDEMRVNTNPSLRYLVDLNM